MPSRKSKPRSNPRSPWKAAPGCSEDGLAAAARELAIELKPGDHVLLEGPMGAGKSTFARHVLHALGVHQPPEGSPTFAIAHEYDSPRGGVVHIDFYRLKAESEIDDAGIPDYFWERALIVLAEWTSNFPDFERAVVEDSGGRCFQVKLDFAGEPEKNRRNLEIFRS